MSGGSWDPTALPIRPGLYINFVESAIAQIAGGERGTVAIPLVTFSGTAVAKQFYTIENQTQANELFGEANAQSVVLALQGGAKEVLVYTMPAAPLAADYDDMRLAFDARPFNVFVYDDIADTAEQADALAWVKRNRDEGKHFAVVFGGSTVDDQDPTVGNARTTTLSDDYTVNLISGVEYAGDVLNSTEFAPFIAGLIAGTPINRSITFKQLPVSDVTKRLTNSQIKTALQAGSLVLVHDGEKVKVEQGLVTSKKKIRAIRARQAVSTDVSKTANDSYIGKIDNNADGHAALISAVKAYLETLENANVLTDIVVGLDPQRASEGDSVFLAISYREIDSMERIFLTINV
jgi:Phage tail sheath C-terminal domain/Phage tail sheath protein subtilisin-like domain